MSTFTSCGLFWYPVPDDGKIPCDPDQHIRVLLNDEKTGYQKYSLDHDPASCFPWAALDYAGWFPVNPDGTEIKKPARPRVLRRRFPLARGVRPTW